MNIFYESVCPPLTATACPAPVSGKGRSLAHDQLEIFGSIERSLSSVGVEGRPCLLRFICEMHQRPIGRNSILGEVFDVVFS